jgi:hypothetical protein
MGGFEADTGSPSEAALQAEIMLHKAIEAAEARGSGTGNWKEVANLAGQVASLPWPQLMRRWLLRKAKVRRTYNTPNRRMQGHDVLIPGRGGKVLGHIA